MTLKFLASLYPSAWPLGSFYLMRNEWGLLGNLLSFHRNKVSVLKETLVYSQLNKKKSCHFFFNVYKSIYSMELYRQYSEHIFIQGVLDFLE